MAKKRNMLKTIRKWGDLADFPVTSIHELGALAYIYRSNNCPTISEEILEWQAKMRTREMSETDLTISVGDSNES